MSRINLLLFLALAIGCDCSLVHAEDVSSAFIIGADISWVQQQEDERKRWFDDGVQKDILAILKDHGFNWIRLRVFVNPAEEGGYSPVVYGNRVSVTSEVEESGKKSLLTLCFDRRDGKELWRQGFGFGVNQRTHEKSNLAVNTPAVTEDAP